MAPWNLSGTTQVSQYQTGKTRKVKPIWIYWSKRQWVAVVSAGPYANLHLIPFRQPRQWLLSNTKFGASPYMGASRWIDGIWKFFFIYALFLGTRLHVRPVGGFSHLIAQITWTRARCVPFGGFVQLHIAAHLKGHIPPKPYFWGANRRFQAKYV